MMETGHGTIRNLILDWSGTLVDDLPPVWEATNHVLRRAGRTEISLDEFRSAFSLPFTGFYERYLPDMPMEQLEEWFHAYFRQVQDSVALLPHARRFLELCRRHGLRTFLLSTVHPDHYKVQSERLGLDGLIETPYVGIWDKRTRIGEILATHRLAPHETLFVGDMAHDIDTARHGGIFSCGVLTGYNRYEQLRVSAPSLIVEHLGELGRLLEESAFRFPGTAQSGTLNASAGTGGSEPGVGAWTPGRVERERAPRTQSGPAAGGIEPSNPGEAQRRYPLVTVGALIFNHRDEVLMIRTQKWSDLWGIPGGKVQYGERTVDALVRELREETNLTVSGVRFVMVQDCIHSPEFYRDAHFVLLNYICRVVGEPTVRLNQEAQTYRWLRLEAAFDLPLNTPTRRLLETVRDCWSYGHD